MEIITNTVKKIFTHKKVDPGAGWDVAAKTFLCLAFFLTPLWVGWWTNEIWESHKLLLLLTLISGGWLCYWIAVLRRRTVNWYWGRIDWLIVAVVVVAGLSTLTSINPWQSFVPGSASYGESVSGLVALLGLYILTIQVFRHRHDQLMGWSSVIAGIVVVTLMQLWQFAGFSLWPPALPTNPFFSSINGSIEGLATIAALVSSISLLGWTMARERWHKLLVVAGTAVGWFILLVTGQALGWAVFALGMVIVVLSQARQGANASARLIGVAVGLAVLGMIAQFTNVASHTSLQPVNDPKLDTTTNATISWTTLVKNIPFGSGPATWYYDFVSSRPLSYNATPYWNIRFAQASNQWWQITATTGVVGLFAWLALAVASVVMIWRRWQRGGEWTVGVGLLVSTTILLTSFFTTWSLVLLTLWFACFGLIRGMMPSNVKSEPLNIRTGLGFAVTLVLALLWWYPAGRIHASDIATRNAVQAINRVEPITQVEQRLLRALRLNPSNLNAAALLANTNLVELQLSVQNNEDATVIQAITRKIAQQLLSLQSIDPKNPVGYEISNNILSALTGLVGDVEVEAQKNFLILQKLEPASPIHDIGYGQALMVSRARILAAETVTDEQQQQAEKLRNQAIAAYDQAIQKKPDYFQAHLSRAQALSEGGQYEPALAELESVLVLYPQIAGLWAEQGNILSLMNRSQEAVASYEQAIRLDPTDPSIYIAYSEHYTLVKDVVKAKEVLERGLLVLPGNGQLQQVLDSLN